MLWKAPRKKKKTSQSLVYTEYNHTKVLDFVTFSPFSTTSHTPRSHSLPYYLLVLSSQFSSLLAKRGQGQVSWLGIETMKIQKSTFQTNRPTIKSDHYITYKYFRKFFQKILKFCFDSSSINICFWSNHLKIKINVKAFIASYYCKGQIKPDKKPGCYFLQVR